MGKGGSGENWEEEMKIEVRGQKIDDSKVIMRDRVMTVIQPKIKHHRIEPAD